MAEEAFVPEQVTTFPEQKTSVREEEAPSPKEKASSTSGELSERKHKIDESTRTQLDLNEEFTVTKKNVETNDFEELSFMDSKLNSNETTSDDFDLIKQSQDLTEPEEYDSLADLFASNPEF